MKKSPCFLLIILSSVLTFGQTNVFEPNQEYTYNFAYLTEALDTVAKGIITVLPTSRQWEPDKSQTAVVYNYSFEIRDDTYFQIGEHGLPITTIETETTGFIEDERSFGTHPFRSNIFYITEVAPFPSYAKSAGIVKLKSTVLIGSGWGKFKGKCKSRYYQTEYIDKVGEFNGLKLSKVTSSSRHQLGRSNLEMLISENFGIVKMRYDFFNKDKLVIKQKLNN